MNLFYKIGIISGFAMLLSPVARGSFLDDAGVTALRSVTNLDGTGIRVAQPEASSDGLTWEVNPSTPDVSQPVGKFTYTSSLGSATNFPNGLGSESGHAGIQVGGFLYGMVHGVATNVAYVDNYEANYFINNIVAASVPPLIAASLVNQSFVDTNTNNEPAYDTAYDNYAAQYSILFISGAGNGGGPVLPPSTSYNGISVGAYQNYLIYGSTGPTPVGGRCKPDIMATADITSTSTPQVCGAAALLEQAALRGDGGLYTNAAFNLRTVKALLLNGAVKPADWTRTNAMPLDLRYGAGVVNVFNSYKQLVGGKWNAIVSNTVATGGAHPPTGATGTVGVLSGWNLATNTSSAANDSIHHYYFNVTNSASPAKFTVTVTLVWMRHKNQTSINNLDLFLYDCATSNLVASSTSSVDNVEHIWKTDLPAGRYDLQVWKAGGSTVSFNETYALAFEFVTPPVLSLMAGNSSRLQWPAYPAGYLVEFSTNLLTGIWNTNGLPFPAVTNGLDSMPLNMTNALQFFRLRKPNL